MLNTQILYHTVMFHKEKPDSFYTHEHLMGSSTNTANDWKKMLSLPTPALNTTFKALRNKTSETLNRIFFV